MLEHDNLEQIEALADEELRIYCYDKFSQVYDSLTHQTSRNQIIAWIRRGQPPQKDSKTPHSEKIQPGRRNSILAKLRDPIIIGLLISFFACIAAWLALFPGQAGVESIVNELLSISLTVTPTAAKMPSPIPGSPLLTSTVTTAPSHTPTESPAFCDAVTTVPREECRALVDLYNVTGGSTWTSKKGWLKDRNPCNWEYL